MAEQVVDFDPNLNLSGRMSVKTIRLVFGCWKYRKEVTVEVGGNCSGLSNISTAVGRVFDDLPDDDFGQPMIVLVDAKGQELECSDDDGRCEDWLEDMLISAEVLDVRPQLEPLS